MTDVEAGVAAGATSLKTGVYIQQHAKQGYIFMDGPHGQTGGYIYGMIFFVVAHGGSRCRLIFFVVI